MEEAQKTGWNRREFSGAAALLALAMGVPVTGAMLTSLDQAEAPSERQLQLMREAAQQVIPATDTPGAGDAGAGAFVILALAHGLEGTRQRMDENAWVHPRFLRADGSLQYIAWLESALDRKARGNWLGSSPEDRAAMLAELDAAAFAADAGDHPWRKLKALILIGYYTSEAGGSQELNYAAVPGQFDPRVPVKPDTRAFSNDWSALEFG